MDATFWAFISLILFLALIAYLKVPGMVARSLDQRADRIRRELEDARALREEAQQLLAEYQRKRHEAEQEAAELVTAAKREAEGIIADAKASTEEYVTRRTKLAEQKIAQAERDAVNEVRARAVDVAVAAASKILSDKVDSPVSGTLFDESITQLKAKLN